MKYQFITAGDTAHTDADPLDDRVGDRSENRLRDRRIGEIIREAKNLSEDDIGRVLGLQRQFGVRFGEAAIALKLATQEDVLSALSQQFHYPYFGEQGLEFSNELCVARDPFSDEAEIFRDLRSQLLGLMSDQARHNALAITSANVGDGKSFFAANLAVSFSQLGGRTLLIDADMRTPRQHSIFDLHPEGGLSALLAGRSEGNMIQPVPGLPSLYVLPVGVVPPNPLELLQQSAFSVLLRELRSKFDYILVDSPAASHGADAKVIGIHCRLALAIGRQSRTSISAVRKLLDGFTRGNCTVAGVVMNEY
jgi:protein-tyrosine kinase